MTDKKRIKLRGVAYAAFFAALTAVCSFVSIPTSPPVTLQLFSVALSLYLLGARGIVSCAVYIGLGAVGLPVFAGFAGGIGHFITPSGGYILGFLLFGAVYAISLRLMGNTMVKRIIASIVALILFYAFAALWYTFVYLNPSFSGFITALAVGAAPFILPDIAKLVLAFILAERLRPYVGIL